MSLKSRFITQVERGGYSAIVYKDGNLYVAEDDVGTIISENSNAAVVCQAAVNNGGKIYFIGNFSIDDTINLPSNTIVEGFGPKTVIVQTANKPIFSLIGTVGTPKVQITINNMFLYGTNPATNTSQYGIRMKYTSNIVMNRVYFYTLYDGIHAETWFYDTWMYACSFDSQIEHNAMYLHADADWDGNFICITDCFLASKGNNIDYTHAMAIMVKGCYFFSTAASNIYGVRAYGINVSLTDFDGSANAAIHENEYIRDSRFTSFWMTGTTTGFYFKNCYAINFSGSRVCTPRTGIEIDSGGKIAMIGMNMVDCAYSPAAAYPCIKLGTTNNVYDIVITGSVIGSSDNTYSIQEKAGNTSNVIVGNNLQKAALFAVATEHAHNYSP